MKIIENNIIPCPGFGAINLFGVVFVRKDKWQKSSGWYKHRTKNHEGTHSVQMDDFGLLFFWCPPLQRIIGGIIFYGLYFREWVAQIILPPKGAYRWISFEHEAYAHEDDDDYLKNRKHFAQWKKNA